MPRLFSAFLLVALIAAPLRLAAQMAASYVPFELANNLILVEAEVDGRRGWFFFDTGAPKLALNTARWPDRQPNGATAGGIDATGTHTAPQTTVAKFTLGHVVQENIAAGLLNLAHLERVTGRELLGLIGYENVRSELVIFDYAAKQVRLLPPAALGHLPPPRVSVPFTLERHLPVIAAEIGGRALRLAVDSGAAAGMLDVRLKEELQPHLATDGAVALAGAGGQSAGTMERRRGTLTLGGAEFPGLVFLFAPMDHFRAQGGGFDGIVGYHLLSSSRSAIDYAGRRLLFW